MAGVAASGWNESERTTGDRSPALPQRHLDWPLLAFWVGYLAIFGGSVWLFVH